MLPGVSAGVGRGRFWACGGRDLVGSEGDDA